MLSPSNKLYVLAGIPGSGKSTWAKEFFPDLDIVSSDLIRRLKDGGTYNAELNKEVFEEFYDTIKRCLQQGRDVVADATFLTQPSREKAKEIAYEVGVEAPHLVLFDNLTQALRRNKNRKGVERVPDDAMIVFLDKYERTCQELPSEEYATVTRIEQFG